MIGIRDDGDDARPGGAWSLPRNEARLAALIAECRGIHVTMIMHRPDDIVLADAPSDQKVIGNEISSPDIHQSDGVGSAGQRGDVDDDMVAGLDHQGLERLTVPKTGDFPKVHAVARPPSAVKTAIASGFSDISCFNRFFKTRFDAAPSGVRERPRAGDGDRQPQ
ncbi:MAG: hypothetical protein HXY30_03265 [Pseudorhodoplanes sp.]|nr:hypothetical protein [Pseudorhodoplanes sp.]